MSDAYPNCSMCSEDLIPDDGELCGACARAVSDTAKEMIAAAEARSRAAALGERDREWLAALRTWPRYRPECLSNFGDIERASSNPAPCPGCTPLRALVAAAIAQPAAALAGCVPVPRELFDRVLAALKRDIWTDLAAELRALPGSEGNEATG